ncbi:MAG: hypothetical protein ABJB11_24705 [Ferruginibacter sp.]
MKFNLHLNKCAPALGEIKRSVTLMILLPFVLLLAASCNNSTSDKVNPANDSTSAKKGETTSLKKEVIGTTNTAKLIDTELTTYYIENFPVGSPAKNPFAELIGTTPNQYAKRKKVVFQFLINNAGELTVRAFASMDGGQDFIQPGTVFKVGSVVAGTDLTGLNFSLGDQEISSRTTGSDFTVLRNAVGQADKKYIILKPSIVNDDDPEIKKIKFDIGYNDTPPSKLQPFVYQSFNISSPNPSPPKNSQ